MNIVQGHIDLGTLCHALHLHLRPEASCSVKAKYEAGCGVMLTHAMKMCLWGGANSAGPPPAALQFDVPVGIEGHDSIHDIILKI